MEETLHTNPFEWDWQGAIEEIKTLIQAYKNPFSTYRIEEMPLYKMSEFKTKVVINETGGAFKYSIPF